MLGKLIKTLFRRPAATNADWGPVRAALSAGHLLRARELAEATLKIAPHEALGWNVLGAIAAASEDHEYAISAFTRACELLPDNAEQLGNLGEVYRRTGRLDLAKEVLAKAIALDPESSVLHLNFGLVLRDTGDISGAKAHFLNAIYTATQIESARSAHTALLFLLCHDPEADLALTYAEHCNWGDRHANPLAHAPAFRPHNNGKRLRLGYISGDFNRHSLSYFLEPLLAHHDHDRFEIFCYRNGGKEDEVTAQLRTYPHTWNDIGQLDDSAAAQLIAADHIDVLIDLSGHTARGRLPLFARRPAPVQISYLGYLNTSGVAAIDYRITDAIADPPDVAEPFHREHLLRLPCTQWCYRPPTFTPEVTPLPAVTTGNITFGALHSFTKLNPFLLRLWGQLLVSLPHASLRIYGVPAGPVKENLYADFAHLGIGKERLNIAERVDFERYLETYQFIDIALDAYPYNGATTTCEALWMGVPVVSLAGHHGAARSGASLLNAIGQGWLVANTAEDYIKIARSLATDLGQLTRLRSNLREIVRSSPLCDETGFTRAFEAIVIEAFEACNAISPAASTRRGN